MCNFGRLGAVAACALIPLAFAAFATTPGSATYSYDGVGRLKSVIYEDGSGQFYTYDSAGNRQTSVSGTPITFSISAGATVNEGSGLAFTITKSGNAAATATVQYATQDGSAHAGTNYTATSGTLTFSTSQTTQTITVPTTHDGTYDGALKFYVNLSQPTTSAIATGTATGTINEIDPAPVFSVAAPAAVTEGGTLNFTVTRSNPTTLAQTVNFATSNGSAVAGTDYTATNVTLSFSPGSTSSQTVAVQSIADSLYEGSRSFSATLSSPSNGAVLSSSQYKATGTINDASSPPSLAINSPAAVNASLPVSFTVSETFAAGTTGTRTATTVNWATANGTAVAGTNYTAASGTLSFPSASSGNQTQTFSVNTLASSSQTAALSFTAKLSGANNSATITTATGTATINPQPQIPSVPTLSPTSQQDTNKTGTFSLGWTAADFNPTRYELWLGGTSGTLIYSGTALSYSGSQGFTINSYEVRACNAAGCSGLSNSARVTTCNGTCQ